MCLDLWRIAVQTLPLLTGWPIANCSDAEHRSIGLWGQVSGLALIFCPSTGFSSSSSPSASLNSKLPSRATFLTTTPSSLASENYSPSGSPSGETSPRSTWPTLSRAPPSSNCYWYRTAPIHPSTATTALLTSSEQSLVRCWVEY